MACGAGIMPAAVRYRSASESRRRFPRTARIPTPSFQTASHATTLGRAQRPGGVPEWFNGLVLKTSEGVTLP